MIDKKIKSFWNERWAQLVTKWPTKKCNYEISDYGRVKSINKESGEERLLKGSKVQRGQILLNIRLQGNHKQGIYVHKFVAEQFVQKTDDSQEFIIHLDQNKENNHYKNLKWVNQRELTDWQIATGVYHPENRKRGTNTKMTETKVRLLRKRIKEGKTKKKILAKSFGISTMQLKRIEKRENWSHI